MRGSPCWPGLLLGALLVAAAPSQARAEGVDFDAIDQADVLQKQALKAARAGNWALARQLAEEVLTLDVSFATAPSRLVLARALQQEKNFDGALYELRQLERLEGVPDKIAEEVADLRAETEAMRARAERQAARPSGVAERNAGIGFLAGGAAPLVVGGIFVANDAHHAAQGTDSGTWAVIGAPVLATGVILEVVGAALLTRAPRRATASTLRLDGVAFGLDADRLWLGVTGRF